MEDKEIEQNMEEVRIKEKIIKDFNITYTSNGSSNEWRTGMDITPSMIVSFLKRNIEQTYSLGQSHMKQKAVDCVPKKRDYGEKNEKGFCTTCHYLQCKCAGFNDCREQTLSALNNL